MNYELQHEGTEKCPHKSHSFKSQHVFFHTNGTFSIFFYLYTLEFQQNRMYWNCQTTEVLRYK